ncbi:MAG: hypothetical protein Q9192_005100 [Flavoplaca navasiana]
MSRPAGETPAAFNLIRMVGAVVEMVAYAIICERAATAIRHGEVMGDSVVYSAVGSIENQFKKNAERAGDVEKGLKKEPSLLAKSQPQ